MNLQDLHKPFPENDIHWRIGSMTKDKTRGLALAYLDARNVMERLDEVCGPLGWQDSYVETPTGRVICTISINFGPNEWVSKSDGAGNTDIEGDKGGISDAFKRAAVKWGVGRYLYALESPWVGVDKYKKILPEEKDKLLRVLRGATVPDTQPKAKARNYQAEFVQKIRSYTSVDELDAYWATDKAKTFVDSLPANWKSSTFVDFIEHGMSIAESEGAASSFYDAYKDTIEGLPDEAASDLDAKLGALPPFQPLAGNVQDTSTAA